MITVSMVSNRSFFTQESFFQVLLLFDGMYNVDSNINIAGCDDPNEHVNAILEYGASETVPDWSISCSNRGYVCNS